MEPVIPNIIILFSAIFAFTNLLIYFIRKGYQKSKLNKLKREIEKSNSEIEKKIVEVYDEIDTKTKFFPEDDDYTFSENDKEDKSEEYSSDDVDHFDEDSSDKADTEGINVVEKGKVIPQPNTPYYTHPKEEPVYKFITRVVVGVIILVGCFYVLVGTDADNNLKSGALTTIGTIAGYFLGKF